MAEAVEHRALDRRRPERERRPGGRVAARGELAVLEVGRGRLVGDDGAVGAGGLGGDGIGQVEGRDLVEVGGDGDVERGRRAVVAAVDGGAGDGVVAPAGKVLPEAGSQATGTGPSTRSAAVGAVQETTAPLGPSAGTLMSAGVPLMAAPSCRRR